MHSPACSIHVSAARRDVVTHADVSANLLDQLRSPRIGFKRAQVGPQLAWRARVKGQDPCKLIDIDGVLAFRRAGLYAFARPSNRVALFVFDPNADGPGWRYEAWFIAHSSDRYPFRLDRPIVGDKRMACLGDAVEAMRRCELDAAAKFQEWLGGVL